MAEAAQPCGADHDEPAAHASQRTKVLLAAIEALPPRCREAFVPPGTSQLER